MLSVHYFDCNQALLENIDPVASRIELTEAGGEKTNLLSGGSVFKGYRLAGWLTEIETRGYLKNDWDLIFTPSPCRAPSKSDPHYTQAIKAIGNNYI